MAKHHINPETYRVGVCRASSNEKCPLKGEHFENAADANYRLNEMLEEEFGVLPKATSRTGKNLALERALDSMLLINPDLNQGDRIRVEALFQTCYDSLQSPVESTDEEFASSNETFNTVERLTLEDGTVGYFKPVSPIDFKEGWNAAQSLISEVLAFRLAQKLGEGFDRLVPETSLRIHNGKIGSIQKEVSGLLGIDKVPTEIDRKHLLHCAVFDYLIGNIDRHDANYMIVEPPEEYRLIDNGLAFGGGEYEGYPSGFADKKIAMTMEESDYIKGRLKVLQDSDGFRQYMTPDAVEEFDYRLTSLLNGYFDRINEDDLWDF